MPNARHRGSPHHAPFHCFFARDPNHTHEKQARKRMIPKGIHVFIFLLSNVTHLTFAHRGGKGQKKRARLMKIAPRSVDVRARALTGCCLMPASLQSHHWPFMRIAKVK